MGTAKCLPLILGLVFGKPKGEDSGSIPIRRDVHVVS